VCFHFFVYFSVWVLKRNVVEILKGGIYLGTGSCSSRSSSSSIGDVLAKEIEWSVASGVRGEKVLP